MAATVAAGAAGAAAVAARLSGTLSPQTCEGFAREVALGITLLLVGTVGILWTAVWIARVGSDRDPNRVRHF
jgi:hypothetical protein